MCRITDGRPPQNGRQAANQSHPFWKLSLVGRFSGRRPATAVNAGPTGLAGGARRAFELFHVAPPRPQCCHKRYTLNPPPTLWGQGISLGLIGEVVQVPPGPYLDFHNLMEHMTRGRYGTRTGLVSRCPAAVSGFTPRQVRKPSSQGFCPEDSSRQISRINPGPW